MLCIHNFNQERLEKNRETCQKCHISKTQPWKIDDQVDINKLYLFIICHVTLDKSFSRPKFLRMMRKNFINHDSAIMKGDGTMNSLREVFFFEEIVFREHFFPFHLNFTLIKNLSCIFSFDKITKSLEANPPLHLATNHTYHVSGLDIIEYFN